MPITGLAKSAGSLLWVIGRLWLKLLWGTENGLGGHSEFCFDHVQVLLFQLRNKQTWCSRESLGFGVRPPGSGF